MVFSPQIFPAKIIIKELFTQFSYSYIYSFFFTGDLSITEISTYEFFLNILSKNSTTNTNIFLKRFVVISNKNT